MNAKEYLEKAYPDMDFCVTKNTDCDAPNGEWMVEARFETNFVGLFKLSGNEMEETSKLKEEVNELINSYTARKNKSCAKTGKSKMDCATIFVLITIISLVVIMLIKK